MHTSTLEPLTMLTPLSENNRASDEQCGCGCGCEVSLTQLALGATDGPERSAVSAQGRRPFPQGARRRRGDEESTQTRC